MQRKPRLALVLGDPAGVGPELMARLLARPETLAQADLLIVGDRRILARGEKAAGVTLDVETVRDRAQARPAADRLVMLDTADMDPALVPVGEVSEKGGRSAIGNYRIALDLAKAGVVDGVTFVPFNKQAIRYSVPGYEDELKFAAEHIGYEGAYAEFNVMEGLWNARVTSHVPIREVADLITEERILERLELTLRSLAEAGIEKPRVAVAALNPHAGDGGAFGREDIDVIEPAVRRAQKKGLAVEGPFPSDTVFLRAKRGDFDAVLTMYHDQGQIAFKLLGFDTGVTVLGGLPMPITTPAHGTAYDIAGKGVANLVPTIRAFEIACKMAEARG